MFQAGSPVFVAISGAYLSRSQQKHKLVSDQTGEILNNGLTKQ